MFLTSLFKGSRVFSQPLSFQSLLNLCSTLKHFYQVHGFMIARGYDRDDILLSKFIDKCSSLRYTDYGYSLFFQQEDPNLYLYNTVIKALTRTGFDNARMALSLYNDVRVKGMIADTYTVPFALKAVVRLGDVVLGRAVHCQSTAIGLDLSVEVVTGLIQMYSSLGHVSDAQKLFDGMCDTDVAFWNAMIAGYAKAGDIDNARELFERMSNKDVISWTTVIAGYVQVNRPNEAIAIFRRMQLENVKPDEIAMLAALSACADLGALELGEWIHKYIDIHGLQKIVPIGNALTDMYAKSGNINKAIETFEKMEQRNVITWTTMISGLALHGLGKEVVEMFSRMERARVKPNGVTFIAILSACSHAGLVEIGWSYFKNMSPNYGIKPQIEHYGCMIDLLSRCGYLCEAQQLVKEMPYEANEAIWGSLLAASRVLGDAELGRQALRHLISLEPRNSGNYMLLSNIYASVGRWNEAGMVRKEMRNTGVRKMPGGSSIEVGNRIHEFIAGDRSHPHFETVYDTLCMIDDQLKIAGYAPKDHTSRELCI